MTSLPTTPTNPDQTIRFAGESKSGCSMNVNPRGVATAGDMEDMESSDLTFGE